MGKSINSWNSYVGHIEHDGKNDSPEKRLFVAVLSQAAHDCFSIHVERHDKEQAKHFFLTDHFHFDLICELADRNPLYVKDKMRKKIIMNIDLPKMNGLRLLTGMIAILPTSGITSSPVDIYNLK